MAESGEKYDNNNTVAIEDIIDAKFDKVRNLERDIELLTAKQRGRLTKSLVVKEVEISLTDEVKLLCDKKAAIGCKIETTAKLVNEKHAEVEKIQSAKELCGNKQLARMIIYENTLEEGLPRFRNALRIYNEEYLSTEIERVRNEGRIIEQKIGNLDQEIEALVSKYKLDEIKNIQSPGREAAITKLSNLRQTCSNSILDKASARKLREYLNKDLGEKVKINERKIARFI